MVVEQARKEGRGRRRQGSGSLISCGPLAVGVGLAKTTGSRRRFGNSGGEPKRTRSTQPSQIASLSFSFFDEEEKY
jgi:hypothetical protein